MTVAFLHDAPAIGHNGAPEPTPFEQSKERIEGLYAEAKNWCDGEPVTSQQQADEIQRLMRSIQEAEKEAEARRKVEAQPFDDGKAEVQARYNPLIQKDKGKASMAVAACKSALAVWLRKLDDENRAKAEAARKEAEEKARIAQEAVRQRVPDDLEQREQAERMLAEAKASEAAATRAENAKAQAKGAGRAASLRSYWIASVTNYKDFARHLWVSHPEVFEPFLDELASKMASSGSRELPGVSIVEDKRVA